MKVLMNLRLARRSVQTRFGIISFGPNGQSEVEDNVADALSALNGYSVIESETTNQQSDTKNTEEPAVEGKQDKEPEDKETISEEVSGGSKCEVETLTRDELDNRTVPAIKKYAKDHSVDIEGLTKKAELLDAIYGYEE